MSKDNHTSISLFSKSDDIGKRGGQKSQIIDDVFYEWPLDQNLPLFYPLLVSFYTLQKLLETITPAPHLINISCECPLNKNLIAIGVIHKPRKKLMGEGS